MANLNRDEIFKFIKPGIESFHQKRMENLQSLKLVRILKRKNPYLFKAKNLATAHDLVKSLLDAHLSSQEEGIFGGFLEQLAIFVCSRVHNGKKSAAEGIDLEFEHEGAKYLIAVKSGPHWGNSRQIAKLKDDFRKAKKILGTNTTRNKIIAVNGCCYGKDDKPDKGDYMKLCGQRFWELISDDGALYTAIIEPLGHKAKERNERFAEEYAKIINRFTFEFSEQYCDASGSILWEKLVKLNSEKKERSLKRGSL